MNTLTDRGVVLSVADPNLGVPKFLFQATSVTDDGHVIEGISFDNNLSEIRVEIDPETHNLSGWIRDPKRGNDFKILAEQRFSTAPYFRNPSTALPMKYVSGKFVPPRYTGEGGALFVSKSAVSPTDLWRGQYITEAGSVARFTHAAVDLSRRNLQLVGSNPATRHFLKWVFAVVANTETEEVSLIGMRFDTSFGRTTGGTYVKQ